MIYVLNMAQKLDDQLNEGDLSAAFAIYDLMMKRRYERYALCSISIG